MAKRISLKTVRLVPVKNVKFQSVSTAKGPVGIWRNSPDDGAEGTVFTFEKGRKLVEDFPELIGVVPVLYEGQYRNPFLLSDAFDKAIAEREVKKD